MSSLELINGQLKVKIQPSKGGRIAQIEFSNRFLLADESQFPELYGSVWWPSPQENWIWPPPEILDNGNYQVQNRTRDSLSLLSLVDEKSSIQLKKKYSLCHSKRMDIEYTAKNSGKSAIQLSHWENTRLEKGGSLLIPTSNFIKKIANPFPDDFLYMNSSFEKSKTFNSELDCLAMDITNNTVCFGTGHKKLFALSSMGWSSYFKNGILLIKVFPIVLEESIAPKQGNIEVYISDKDSFLELEQQGHYKPIQPNEFTVYKTHWLFSDSLSDNASLRERFIFINNLLATENLVQH